MHVGWKATILTDTQLTVSGRTVHVTQTASLPAGLLLVISFAVKTKISAIITEHSEGNREINSRGASSFLPRDAMLARY